uniref:Suppressor of IKBKE 1 n=1 Tax=Latimeria chalumnae TaxID=7897 RepID=H3BGK5_LATCH
MTCTIDKILADAKTLLERLKDHDNAAESLIEQSTTLSKRVEDMKEAGTALPEKEIPSKLDRICEMGEVMRVAVHLDDQQFLNLQEKLAQLELENKELKELLSISKGPADVNKEETTENKSQLQN